MADMTITEYEYLATDRNSNVIQAGQEPAIAVQQILNPTSSAEVTLNTKTRFIRIHVTAKMHFKIGMGAQTAATSNTPIGAALTSAMEFVGVIGGNRLAAINGA